MLNVTFNITYFFVNQRFLFRRKVPFFSLPRICLTFFFSHMIHEQILLKHSAMNTYRVNLNDLLDQDEDFLFENAHFRALVRKVKLEYAHLVNPLFDIEAVTCPPELDLRYQRDALGRHTSMNTGDLIPFYRDTFGSPNNRNRLVFDKMIA